MLTLLLESPNCNITILTLYVVMATKFLSNSQARKERSYIACHYYGIFFGGGGGGGGGWAHWKGALIRRGALIGS